MKGRQVGKDGTRDACGRSEGMGSGRRIIKNTQLLRKGKEDYRSEKLGAKTGQLGEIRSLAWWGEKVNGR